MHEQFLKRTPHAGIGAGIICGTLWASAALYFDFPFASLRIVVAPVYLLFIAGLFFAMRKASIWKSIALAAGCFGAVLLWWFSIPPSNNRVWQPDVDRTAWVEINQNHLIVHNLRDCIYRTETDYTARWETRIFDLSALRGVDFFITYWGSPWIAHTIVSFDFGNGEYLPISIEVRKTVGQSYSAVRGFFRQYELIYILSDERDVVRLRTNYRTDEQVYLFRTRATPEQARRLLLRYVDRVNQLHAHPEWYNAMTNNCTTNIFHSVRSSSAHMPWDWRVWLNGKSDEMMYERGDLVGQMPFPELKKTALINPTARQTNSAEDFSKAIRAGRPQFAERQLEKQAGTAR